MNDTQSLAEARVAVLAAEARLVEAMRRSDLAELDALIDDSLAFVGPDGKVYSKAEDLDQHRRGDIRLQRLQVERTELRLHPGVAIAAVHAQLAGSFQGTAFEGRFLYLRTWLHTPEGWRIVAGSASALGA